MEIISSFATAKKIIEVGMQSEEETIKVIDFNNKNNREYEIRHDSNLLDDRCLLFYLRNGYQVITSEHLIVLKHKDLIEQEKKAWDKHKEDMKKGK